ncbi:hypothetical protein PG993_011079 [Apiospora rasikravindrae]|uniref:Uncharacterized protein n=1 Tax=Apiospora rasikravindrae TaxID=990691 RepID=A0ABR1SER1_9PEZI
MVDQTTHRIVANRELQQPFRGVFHASRESRYIANSLYPVRLPMYHFTAFPSLEWHQRNLRGAVEHLEDTLETAATGEIPVSLTLDNFMIGFSSCLIRNLVQIVFHGRPSEAGSRDPERYIEFSSHVSAYFGGVQVFRRLHPAFTNGPRDRLVVWDMANRMSSKVDAALNWHGIADGGTPSYNGPRTSAQARRVDDIDLYRFSGETSSDPD